MLSGKLKIRKYNIHSKPFSQGFNIGSIAPGIEGELISAGEIDSEEPGTLFYLCYTYNKGPITKVESVWLDRADGFFCLYKRNHRGADAGCWKYRAEGTDVWEDAKQISFTTGVEVISRRTNMTDECKHPSAVLSDKTAMTEPATYHCPDCGEYFMNPTDELWQAAVTRIKEAYFPKVVKEIFGPICKWAENEGCVCGPVGDMTDDEYKWSFTVHTKKVPQAAAGTWHPTALGVDFTILESTVTDGNKEGIAFSLDFQGNAGRTYNTVCPMNLTEALWVQIDDDGGISARFADVAIYAVETFNAALEELRRNIEDGELAEAIAEWKEKNESRPLFDVK